jgi:type IV pilus assembly protein PilQ
MSTVMSIATGGETNKINLRLSRSREKRMTKRLNISILAAALAGLTIAPTISHAQETSKAARADLISLKSSDQKGEQSLTFEFAGSRPAVKSFQLANPSRLVIDFAGATNRSQAGGVSYQGSGAQTLDIAGDETRLRTVVTLYEDTEVTDRWVGNQYTLVLSRKSSKTARMKAQELPSSVAENLKMDVPMAQKMTPEMAPMPSQTSNANKPADMIKLAQEILKFDFRKGRTAGSGRLVVDLTNSDTPIDIKSTKGGLIIDFMGTNIPANLARKFDLSDQMTPVSSMEFKQMSDRTRLLMRAQGKWEQSAYQVDNRFFFEVKPVFNDTMSKNGAEGKTFKGDKLTLNFQNIEVRTILQVLSDFSGLNIITSDTVAGSLTLRLKEVPWDQALDLILQAKNLDKRQSGNVIWIAPQDEIRVKEKKDADFRAEQALNQPLVTESFEINYAKAADIKALLGDKTQAILSTRGSVVLDARTNMVFVQDIAEKIESARAMIKKVDVPVKQVMIEARIVEATDTFGKSLGARLGFNQATPGSAGGSRFVVGGGIGNAANTSGQGNGSNFADTYFSSLPAQGNGGNSPSLLSLVLFNSAATRFLNLELSALVSDGRGQILSNPRVVTADKKEASIEQGTQIPYQSASSSGATAVSFKSATLALKVTPQITPNGDVMLDLTVNKDSVGVNTSAGPSIDTKAIKTQVLVEDGGTVVIGGIYTQDDQVNESRVPFFGDLPYIGNLFKTRTTTRDRREMLVFITPKIIADKSVSDDLDAATVKEELIKPILMDQDFVDAKKGYPFLPSLPNDKQKKTRADLE